MNGTNVIDVNPYDRLFEHRQIDPAPTAHRGTAILWTDAKSLVGPLMPLKPAFSTAC